MGNPGARSVAGRLGLAAGLLGIVAYWFVEWLPDGAGSMTGSVEGTRDPQPSPGSTSAEPNPPPATAVERRESRSAGQAGGTKRPEDPSSEIRMLLGSFEFRDSMDSELRARHGRPEPSNTISELSVQRLLQSPEFHPTQRALDGRELAILRDLLQRDADACSQENRELVARERSAYREAVLRGEFLRLPKAELPLPQDATRAREGPDAKRRSIEVLNKDHGKPGVDWQYTNFGGLEMPMEYVVYISRKTNPKFFSCRDSIEKDRAQRKAAIGRFLAGQ